MAAFSTATTFKHHFLLLKQQKYQLLLENKKSEGEAAHFSQKYTINYLQCPLWAIVQNIEPGIL